MMTQADVFQERMMNSASSLEANDKIVESLMEISKIVISKTQKKKH